MSEKQMTPFERAVELVKSPGVCPWLSLKQEQALINAVTTALQAQSNADELRHREKQSALRTLLAEQSNRADEAIAMIESEREQHEMEMEVALSREAALRRALEPFAEFYDRMLDGPDYSYMEDRIQDWLGVSSFKEARAALSVPSPGLDQVKDEAANTMLNCILDNLKRWPTNCDFEVNIEVERLRREAKIEALEALPCAIDSGCEGFKTQCDRCKALVELRKGGE